MTGIMKNNHKLLAFAAALFFAAGCNGFLDRIPVSDVTPPKYFKSADDLAAYTVNYYPTFFGGYVGNYSVGVILEDGETDNLVVGGSSNGTALAYFTPGNTRYLVPSGQATSNAFSRIRICNYFFGQVLPKQEAGSISGTKAEVDHYIGEMYVMRALAYFSALRTFGDFPIIEEVLSDDNDKLVEASKRAPRNQVARFILKDLDQAVALLGDADNFNKTRVTKDLALLIKSRVALYEATFERYHKGTPRVPGEAGWPGASMDYNTGVTFDIDAEIAFFLDECMKAAEQVADKHALVENKHVMNPPKAGEPYGWNPYFELFSMPDPGSQTETILWRAYSKAENILSGQGPYILEGGNCGATRSHIDGFLMANGLPIYAPDSGYHGDETLDDQEKDRDERLQLFVFSNSDINYPASRKVFGAPLFLAMQEHKDVTGFRIRKSFNYDPAQTENSNGNILGTNGLVLYRSAEAFLNYIEAYYEKNHAVAGKADAYWRTIRKRAGVDEDYNKTVGKTELEKEQDWAKYSGDNLIDPVLFNIRRERRCEFIGEGFRWNDLIRWRAFDHLMKEKYIPEGVNLWDKLYSDTTYFKRDANGQLTDETLLVQCADGVTDANVSAKTDSKYIRPLRIVKANNELFEGYTWHKAYYLSPYGLKDLTLTSPDGTPAKSVAYQNPYWPSEAAEGALE